MTKPKRITAAMKPDALFGRVVAILEQARGNVVRAVNTNMVLAYWLIGREIVQDLQAGKDRAGYGKKMLADLSVRLAQRYGNGFSVPNLQNFRKFYLAYSTRGAMDPDIQYPMGTKSVEGRIQYPVGTRSPAIPTHARQGRKVPVRAKGSPSGAVSPQGLSPQLSWSHYRALMRVESREAKRPEGRTPPAYTGDAHA